MHRFVLARSAHVFGAGVLAAAEEKLSKKTTSLLVLPLAGPSLKALIDARRECGRQLSESAVAYLGADMLRALAALHDADMLHCDVRPHNVSLRFEACPGTLKPSAAISGAGWARLGVSVLDFGRAVDVRRYDKGTTFSGDVMADGYECTEMRRKREWTVQIDCYAAAATIYALLHAHEPDERQMRVQSECGVWKLREAIHEEEQALGRECEQHAEEGKAVEERSTSVGMDACIGDRLRARDSRGGWYESKVVDVSGNGRRRELKMHFLGWNAKWDEWIRVGSGRLQASDQGTERADDAGSTMNTRLPSSVWQTLFHQLLNIPAGAPSPDLRRLADDLCAPLDETPASRGELQKDLLQLYRWAQNQHQHFAGL
jgi:hypothetical protein